MLWLHYLQDAFKKPMPSESPQTPSYNDLEETAKKERLRVEELLKSKGIRYGSYPRFTVAVKGQKVVRLFLLTPSFFLGLMVGQNCCPVCVLFTWLLVFDATFRQL